MRRQDSYIKFTNKCQSLLIPYCFGGGKETAGNSLHFEFSDIYLLATINFNSILIMEFAIMYDNSISSGVGVMLINGVR